MKNNEYQCAQCKRIFEKGWSDEEAEKEAEFNFGKKVKNWKNYSVLVCNDCFVKFCEEHPTLRFWQALQN